MRARDRRRRIAKRGHSEATAVVFAYAILRRAFPNRPRDPRSVRQLSFLIWPDRTGSGRLHSAQPVYVGWLIERYARITRSSGMRFDAQRPGLRRYLESWDIVVPYTDDRMAVWVSERRTALREFTTAVELHGGVMPDVARHSEVAVLGKVA